ncbi:hypothetical protein ACPV36_05065 [Photobacterium damselae]|uniref:hypothetical protein n=1 Tax=Photobacterium damselae TaxID=38293 RepID=UPI0040682066
MIIVTMKIHHTQDSRVELDFETSSQGEVSRLESAHTKVIADLIQSPHYQALVELKLLKDCAEYVHDKCQSKEKESEQPESPIQEVQ